MAGFEAAQGSTANKASGILASLTAARAVGGRMERTSATRITLARYMGGYIDVNGEYVEIGSGLVCDSTDNLISSTGANSGSAMSASTLYYMYASNSQATFAPLDLRASTTAPTALTSGTYAGIKYLGTSGNALHWRFVGYVHTNSSTQFTDSVLKRGVINYYNKRLLSLETCPGYTDGNNFTTYTTTSTTYVQANSGTGSRLEFISNGEDAVHYVAVAMASNSGANNRDHVGVGENATTDAAVGTDKESGAGINGVATCGRVKVFTEGYNYLELLIRVGAGTGTYTADLTRGGSAADPMATMLRAQVWG